MKETLWQATSKKKKYPALNKDKQCDILIIGGGITGVNLAFLLRHKKDKLILIEQNELGTGVTQRTTGKLTFLQGDIYHKIITNAGEDEAKKYFFSQKEAIANIRKTIHDYNIDCDLELANSYLFLSNKKNEAKWIKEKHFLEKMDSISQKEFPFPFPYIDFFKMENTFVFHPLKYLYRLVEIIASEKVQLYEHTRAIKIKKDNDHYQVLTNNGEIKAKTVVFCCHYPFYFFPTLLPFHTYLERSYLASFPTDNVHPSQVINIDPDDQTISSRFFQNNFIYLSESQKLGNVIDTESQSQKLSDEIENIFHLKPQYLWHNFDIMTNDGLPIIGRIHRNDDTLLLATGFNTWGMTNSMLASSILSDIINHKKNPYEDLCSPNRLGKINKLTSLISGNLHQSRLFFYSYLKQNFSFYPDNVYITTISGKKCGVYKDNKNQAHIVYLTCPHLKCHLIFDPLDKTWNCPCHGSSFSIDGDILKGPATSCVSCHTTSLSCDKDMK